MKLKERKNKTDLQRKTMICGIKHFRGQRNTQPRFERVNRKTCVRDREESKIKFATRREISQFFIVYALVGV